MRCLEKPRLGMAWELGTLDLGWRTLDTFLPEHHWASLAIVGTHVMDRV